MAEEQDVRGLNGEPAEKTVADIHATRKRGEALSDAQSEWLKANARVWELYTFVFAEFEQPQGKEE